MASPGDMQYGPFLTLSYDRLTALLIPAVNELSKQVAELKQSKRKKMRCTSKWEQLLLHTEI